MANSSKYGYAFIIFNVVLRNKYYIEIRGVVKCTADVHFTQNKAVVDEGAVRILRKQWTPEYKQQFFKKLG
jgi:hypothetical protein